MVNNDNNASIDTSTITAISIIMLRQSHVEMTMRYVKNSHNARNA